MLIYLLFVFITGSALAAGYLHPEKNKLFQVLAFVLIVCFVGFRDFVGADFGDYVIWFKTKSRDQDFEVGYLGLMNFFRILNLGYIPLFFLMSFFTYLFLFLGVRKFTQNQNLALFIFLLIPSMFLLSMNTMRQSLAVSICFYAFYCLIDKKYMAYLLLMFLGMSLHRTVLLPFVLFFLVYQLADKIKAVHVVCLLIGSLVFSKLEIVNCLGSLFQDSRYLPYFTRMKIAVPPLKLIVLNGVACLLLFYFERMKSKYPHQKYFMALFFLSVIFTNFFSLYGDLTRTAYYFKIFEIIVMADFIFLGAKEFRAWFLTGFSICYLSVFVYTLKTNSDSSYKYKYIPYKSVLFCIIRNYQQMPN